MVVVSVKVGVVSNIFVLRLQKFRVFWILWLLTNVRLVLIYFLVYLSIFFVIVNLLLVRDLWLLLVYSSIANSGMILVRVYGSNYFFVLCLYLIIILIILFLIKNFRSYIELLVVVFFF